MSVEKLRCQAMIDAGIENPESKEGIDFCVEQCPYEAGCVLFDKAKLPTKTEIKRNFAKRLHAHGVSDTDIRLIIHCSGRTLKGYLAK